MEASTKRASCVLGSLLVLGGVMLLALPNVSSNASMTAIRPAARQGASTLDSERRAALEKRRSEFAAGAPFAEEEQYILRRFAAGDQISELEADLVASRALYDHFVAGKQLTKEQQGLLERYTQSVARRAHDIADRKMQALKLREAAAAASPAPASPLAPPANDMCAGAEVIPAAGPFPYLTAVTADITDATTTGDPPLPSCQNSVSRSIWYRFTPSATATYTISSCADTPTGTTVDDTVMAIYTSSGGCTGPFTELPITGDTFGCDDDSCALEAFQAVITTKLTASTQYFIVVWEFGSAPPTAGNTAVQLRVTQILPPANDTCASPTALTFNTPVSGTTVAASNDYQLAGSACFTGTGQTASTATGDDVVYSFTAPAAANYSFRVTDYDPNANLVLYVASSCPAGSPPVTVSTCLGAANRDVSSTAEEVKCLALSAGQQVFVFVDEDTHSDGNTFTIEVTRCDQETEPNDTPATATAVTLPVIGIEGSVGTGADVDFYGLGTVAANSRVFAVVDGVAANSSDFDLRVTTSTDTLEFDDLDNAPEFGFQSANVEGTPTPNSSVPLFLRINNPATASEPYRLYAVVQPPGNNSNCNCSATNETEPNNTTGQANWAATNYFYGALAGPAPSTDADIYSFSAQANEIVFLGLDGDPTRDNTPINGQLELLDSSGATLLLVNDPHQASSTTPGSGTLTGTTPFSPGEAVVYRIRTSGTYYARVSIGTSSSMTVGVGDYLLSIARLGPSRQLFDFDRDRKADLSVFRPSAGTWYTINSTNGTTTVTGWGTNNDVIVPGDYDGDSKADIAIFRPSSGWHIISSLNGSASFTSWGTVGDIAVPADYDGDGKTDIAVWRPSSGTWFIIQSSNGSVRTAVWGASGDKPVPADYDGDGKADIAFWRPSTGLWSISFLSGGTSTFFWGTTGDMVTPGDFDRDGKADVAVWRPSNGVWYVINSSTGTASFTSWGVSTDIPVPADYDGDGKTDLAVWRPSSGTWFIIQSSDNSVVTQGWGMNGDIPVPSAYVR